LNQIFLIFAMAFQLKPQRFKRQSVTILFTA